MNRIVYTLSLALTLTSLGVAQVNPDVIVGDLNGTRNYGTSGGEIAYSIGTTSCNVGSTALIWLANTPQHPVIGQNLYRLRGNRFEQLGMSWLKHGFTALQQNLCSPCNANPNGTALGVGCSDPYTASLNGSQGGLGPRFEVNATSGAFPYPFTSPTGGDPILNRRLRCAITDMDPNLNVGARYFAEGHYIHPDDATAGNDLNNASWREVTVSAGSLDLNWQGPTQREEPAILAWPRIDPAVNVVNVDVPGDGRFIVAYKAAGSSTTLGASRFEFAIHNLNSHRSARRITFNMPCGFFARFPAFKDVDYHSGEPFTNVNWTSAVTGTSVQFTNDADFATNPNANALRWGTLYNYAFDADVAPTSITIELFRPGTPSAVTVPFGIPTGPQFQTNPSIMSLEINGTVTTGTVAATVNLQTNTQATLAMRGSPTTQPWDMLFGTLPLVPRSGCALTTLDAQVINIDLSDPNAGLWFNAFQGPTFFAPFQVPFSLPAPATISVQAAILNPALFSGISLTQATQIDVL